MWGVTQASRMESGNGGHVHSQRVPRAHVWEVEVLLGGSTKAPRTRLKTGGSGHLEGQLEQVPRTYVRGAVGRFHNGQGRGRFAVVDL